MKNLLKIISAFIVFGVYSITLGAAVEKFDIAISPTKVKVGESIDITVKALDKDGNVVKDFAGEILIFSQSDPKAEFPGVLAENTYKFKTSDLGQVKFENAVKFTKAGTQDINIYDTSNEDVFGLAEVEVTAGTQTETKGDIEITTPENGVTLASDKVKVSGKTLKNHKVQIILNTDKKTDVISNAEGVFEAELSSVPNGENALVANVLDADGKSIGESTKVLFKIESNAPKFKSIQVNPNTEVVGESQIEVSVDATPGLSKVEIILNDLVQELKETKAGTYTGTITAPKENGEYKIDVIMKNEIGIEAKENGAAGVMVKNIELAAAPVEEALTSTGINCDDYKKELIITNVTLVKMKTKSVLSWDKVEKATSYNLYKKERNGTGMTLIQNVTENQVEITIQGDTVEYDDFAVKAVMKNESCEIESSDYSTMTTVQTGPREFMLIVLSLLMVGGIFYIRRKNA